MSLHPQQPLLIDSHGTIRFRQNGIVRRLFDRSSISLSEIASWIDLPSHDEDLMQIAQLIGYSLGGYAELSYVSDESYDAAHEDARVQGLLEKAGEI